MRLRKLNDRVRNGNGWVNDGKYVSYADALDRIQYLQAEGVVRKARFQKVKTFEVSQ